MRIAFVAQPFDRLSPPVEYSSLAIWIYQVARICARRGHDTIVFANHGRLLRAGSLKSENVEYIHTPTGLNDLLNRLSHRVRKATTRVRNAPSTLPAFASVWRDLGYAVEVGLRSRRLKCDIVHILNYSQFVPVIRRLNPRCRICLHMQCEWLTQLDHTVMESRLKASDLMIGCSEYITQKVAKGFPQYEKRCVTVPNAASVVADNNRSAAEPYNVLFVGRVSPEKGVHDLIRAFHLVLQQFPEARLHIAGGFGVAPVEFLVGLSDEPHVAALRVFYERNCDSNTPAYQQALEKEAGPELGRRIVFEGPINHSKTENFYHRASVLVNPSLSESFGMALVEAMMHRVPVVATRVGGMTNIVDPGRTGFLVEPANPQALAAAICQVLADRERARRMGDAGRARAIEKFSWEGTTSLLLDQYQRILS